MSSRPIYRINYIIWRAYRWTRIELRARKKLKIYHSTPTFLLYLICFYVCLIYEIKEALRVKHLVFNDNCKVPVNKFLLCPLFGHKWQLIDYWNEGEYPEYYCFKCQSRHVSKIVKALYNIK